MKKTRNIVQIKQRGIAFKHNLSKRDLELVKADIALTKAVNKIAMLEMEVFAKNLDREIMECADAEG